MHPVEQENITQDCNDLLSVFETWGWDHPSLAPSLLLGWVGCAAICGAIQWRPHLWITGTKGCGKTTLDKLISGILGGLALPVQGSTTEAGLRQELNGNARPVLFDEFEADNSNAGAIIDAARSAASDNAAPVIKGTPEGRPNIYKLKFSAMFSGIIANLQKEADRSRFVILEMHTLPRDEEQRKHLIDNLNRFDADFGSGLLWRMLDALDNRHFDNSLSTFKTAIRLAGGDERKADVYAHLLATSHVLTSDDIITDEEAKSQAALIAQLDEGEPSDEDVCLSHLLGYRITVEYGYQRTIGEWLLYTREDERTGPTIETALAELARHGVLVDGNTIKVANATSGIKTVYSRSRWAGGSHTRILRRIPKLVAGGSARFAGEQSRYTVIPWNVMFSDHE